MNLKMAEIWRRLERKYNYLNCCGVPGAGKKAAFCARRARFCEGMWNVF